MGGGKKERDEVSQRDRWEGRLMRCKQEFWDLKEEERLGGKLPSALQQPSGFKRSELLGSAETAGGTSQPQGFTVWKQFS